MPAIPSSPTLARQFALAVVTRLRAAGQEAFWAGGCVRDELLGRVPADFDVATSALPEHVRSLFGRHRTLTIGVAFGVVTVIGPPGAGHVEVTTFRTDADSSDGRRPTAVTFSTAHDDAQRRDFTINGLFFDPIAGEVHDYVDGRADLAAGIIRAIGVPTLRFGEDHLRMLRAVRFAASFDFAIDTATEAAIVQMAPLVASVSPERIAAELRAMVSRPGRQRALELLEKTGLATAALGELAPLDPAGTAAWRTAGIIVASLEQPNLSATLAILAENAGREKLRQIAKRLRLSNREARTADWLAAAITELGGVAGEHLQSRQWSQVQPWLADGNAALLCEVLRARATGGRGSAEAAAWLRTQAARPRDEIDPAPLVAGNDLLAAGIPAGKVMGALLVRLRALQLDAQLSTREQAIAWAQANQLP